jgi:hypothetical protein
MKPSRALAASRFVSVFALAIAASAAFAQAPEGKVYTLGPFDRLEVDGTARITLTQGERDQVFVAGDAAVQRGVEVQVTNHRLHIQSGGGWKFWNSDRLQIEVQVRQLSQLVLSGNGDVMAAGPFRSDQLAVSISGAGSVRFDRLTAGRLKFDISGAGDAQLAGQVNELALSVSGKGKLLAEQLRAGSASVSISGVGNANVWVTDTLKVSISGVGTVDYWGQPEVRRSVSGLGSVNALGDKR